MDAFQVLVLNGARNSRALSPSVPLLGTSEVRSNGTEYSNPQYGIQHGLTGCSGI
jgi:hypothetical protein